MDELVFNDQLLVSQSVKEAALVDIPNFISSDKKEELYSSSLKIAAAFNKGNFSSFTDNCDDDTEKKLIESFKKNVNLLVQKTWVEKDDEEFKEETLYRIQKLCDKLISGSDKSFTASFSECFSILYDVVVLLFGDMVRENSFLDYAFRIDPDFGFFWYYIERISKIQNFSEDKARCSILLAMFFLANF